MRIVVTGRTGQVASALVERAALERVKLFTIGRPELDLADAEEGLANIAKYEPDVIVSAAAYTGVDKAEDDRVCAELVNKNGPQALARLANELGIPIVHLSTDYVFDGRKETPYVETDSTNPLSVYGCTKLAGEHAVAAATQNYAVLRTAWVYSPFGNNFVRTMLRVGAERPEIRIVSDQLGNPTSAFDIADAILTVARNLHSDPTNLGLRGVFHMSGNGEATWADFAAEIFSISQEFGGPSAEITRITTAEYPTVALRPANSRLDCGKLNHSHGITMPEWVSSLRVTLERLLPSI